MYNKRHPNNKDKEPGEPALSEVGVYDVIVEDDPNLDLYREGSDYATAYHTAAEEIARLERQWEKEAQEAQREYARRMEERARELLEPPKEDIKSKVRKAATQVKEIMSHIIKFGKLPNLEEKEDE